MTETGNDRTAVTEREERRVTDGVGPAETADGRRPAARTKRARCQLPTVTAEIAIGRAGSGGWLSRDVIRLEGGAAPPAGREEPVPPVPSQPDGRPRGRTRGAATLPELVRARGGDWSDSMVIIAVTGTRCGPAELNTVRYNVTEVDTDDIRRLPVSGSMMLAVATGLQS